MNRLSLSLLAAMLLSSCSISRHSSAVRSVESASRRSSELVAADTAVTHAVTDILAACRLESPEIIILPPAADAPGVVIRASAATIGVDARSRKADTVVSHIRSDAASADTLSSRASTRSDSSQAASPLRAIVPALLLAAAIILFLRRK